MKEYDAIIIGGGVSGTSLAYTLSNYSDVGSVLLVEKHEDFAQVSSHYTQNSQTLHFGDIETHYSYDKARKVKAQADLLKHYLEREKNTEDCYVKRHKMAIGVGKEEADGIRERFKNLQKIFPDIELIEREEIQKYEPKVMEGRNPDQEVVAILSHDGYIMNYYELSRHFIQNSDVETSLGNEVKELIPQDDCYLVKTAKGDFKASYVVCDAGAMSMKFAKDLGYGKHLTVLSLAGNFFRGPEALNGKVYTWQHPKRPNAAIHGDPDVVGEGYTRFGPTALAIWMLERRNWSTVTDYFSTVNFSLDGILSIIKTGVDPDYFWYMLENLLIEIPVMGRIILSKRHVEKIVPTIKWWQLKKDKGYGATRPQLIDTNKKEVAMGEARIEGDNIIFNITPSPGASTCLANAERDARQLCEDLDFNFSKKEFDKAFR